MNGIIYLAAPYSHQSEAVRASRAAQIRTAHARLILAGHVVYSPICQSHGMAVDPLIRVPTDFAFWEKSCLAFLEVCSTVVVLKLPEWTKSVGVSAEVELATKLGKKLLLYTPEELLQVCERLVTT